MLFIIDIQASVICIYIYTHMYVYIYTHIYIYIHIHTHQKYSDKNGWLSPNSFPLVKNSTVRPSRSTSAVPRRARRWRLPAWPGRHRSPSVARGKCQCWGFTKRWDMRVSITGWWFGCHQFYFPHINWVSNHPNWLSYFSEGWPNHQPDRYLGIFQLVMGVSYGGFHDGFLKKLLNVGEWVSINIDIYIYYIIHAYRDKIANSRINSNNWIVWRFP